MLHEYTISNGVNGLVVTDPGYEPDAEYTFYDYDTDISGWTLAVDVRDGNNGEYYITIVAAATPDVAAGCSCDFTTDEDGREMVDAVYPAQCWESNNEYIGMDSATLNIFPWNGGNTATFRFQQDGGWGITSRISEGEETVAFIIGGYLSAGSDVGATFDEITYAFNAS